MPSKFHKIVEPYYTKLEKLIPKLAKEIGVTIKKDKAQGTYTIGSKQVVQIHTMYGVEFMDKRPTAPYFRVFSRVIGKFDLKSEKDIRPICYEIDKSINDDEVDLIDNLLRRLVLARLDVVKELSVVEFSHLTKRLNNIINSL